jgi:hypothetical protein
MRSQKGRDLRIAGQECGHARRGSADCVIVLAQHTRTRVGTKFLRVGLEKVDHERKTLKLNHGHDDSSSYVDMRTPFSLSVIADSFLHGISNPEQFGVARLAILGSCWVY